jgi:hypothetical protein
VREGVNPHGEIQADADPREQILAECLSACAACASAAENCAVICLREESPKALARMISLARTCADVCLLTTRLLAQESEFVQEYCALCAEVCHMLREECLKQPSLSCCQRCADLALSCDRACQKAAV